jgi:hypothetical protein
MRWLKIFLVALAIAVAAIVAIVWWVNAADPRVEGRGEAVESWLFPLLNLLLLLGVISAIILIIKYAVKSGMREAQNPPSPIPLAQTHGTALRPAGFPVVTVVPEYSPPTDGPGRYRVQGVNRNTEKDETLEILAESAANAKVKAELKGIVVTGITKTT